MTETPIPPTDLSLLKRIQHNRAGAVVASWDFGAAVVLGASSGLAPAMSDLVATSAKDVLLGLGAAATTLAALTLTGTSVLVANLTPSYRDVLRRLPGSNADSSVIIPFLQVVKIAATAAVLSFAAALLWPLVEHHGLPAWIAFGLPGIATLWALFGFVQTVGSQLPMHLKNAGKADELADKRRGAA